MIYNIPFITTAILAVIGLYAVIFKRNLIKIAIGITILESAVNLSLIAIGYRKGGVAPIYTNLPNVDIPHGMVLPVPQALTLTSIVIGVATLALILAFAMKIYKHYGSLDSHSRRLKE